ncbi:amidohydrolase family protein [Parahaliea mediterranea]|uniref:PD40 domain-containing protein n=1 Tax=Parahaliea mediterranea TaxID=651086 RepID=A0A939DFE6_9GAMM|nr:amidohydrolase family protein [Parahaliea mediterranea]MBN7797196.1 PD40 domain-containing protein [Parahaliea mediterranea]
MQLDWHQAYSRWIFGAYRAATVGALCTLSGLVVAEPEKWDVTDTGQPSREVSFTLTEGTWMSVDVSPDGNTLVFDLLGDLYTMPSTGGKATLLRGGAAVDRIPSFSPDGKRVLYISDRSGDDNVWSIALDGTDARSLTSETTRIMTNPSWSPDGRYIYATGVDIGYSEQKKSSLRIYHIDGGAGHTVVDTPPNGRDVQEPNLSPDGQYLYYTQRLEDHHIFVDANHANYATMRRNLSSGETVELIRGFGGALSPQVSPDSKRLAFVRRVKDKTVLFVYELETGEQRPVYAELDRDQQADFYQQGVYYPQFDWFPDNRHVAIWGKGKLYKVNMDTGEAAEIPFEVESRHRIIDTERFADPLAPEHITAKAIRTIAITRDQRSVIFHALGHLWRKPLPDGVPRRLTSASAFEFEPSISPDGRRLAYVEWDDEKGSSLIVMSITGRGRTTVVSTRGVIRQPAFSPDGTYLVYNIDEGDKGLSGYRATSGLYRVPVSGGDPQRLGGVARYPGFVEASDRVYFTQATADGMGIFSATAEGYDQRAHALARGADRSELQLSPDGKWLTFKENQQYYIMPYQETGAALEASAEHARTPLTRLTASSGYNLAWSPDSRAVYWTLGDQLFRWTIEDLATGQAQSAGPLARFGLTIAADTPEGLTAFTGGQVITMNGEEIIERGTVLVEGNRIVAVGPVEEVEIPASAKRIDTEGKTVMPGLVDMHGHIDCCYYGGLMPQKHPSHYAAASFGITTNYDPYTSEIEAYAATEMLQAGVLVGPRFITTGKVVYGRKGKGDRTYVPLSRYADAEDTMRRKRAFNGRVVKSYKQSSRRARQQLVKAGREAGVMVDAEGESHFYLNVGMLLDGHMALEHNIPVANLYDDLIQLMKHGGAANTPTLNVTFGEIMGENYLYQTTRAWEDPKIRAYVHGTTSSYSPVGTPHSAPVHVRAMTTLHAADEIWDVGFRAVSRSIKKLDDAGVIINAGSHGQVYGLALHWEMQSLAEGGMSHHRVLRTATLNGARTLGLEDQIGSLEPGKLADIIVLERDPLSDIKNTNSVELTMINGRLYDSLSMNEIGHYDRPRSKFYWELPDYQGIDWNEAWSGQ